MLGLEEENFDYLQSHCRQSWVEGTVYAKGGKQSMH